MSQARCRWIAATAATLVLIVLRPPLDLGATFPGTNGRIVFSRTESGNVDIYVTDASGGSVTRLTTAALGDDGPSWSPDGKKIAFSSYRDGAQAEIYVMNADGTNQTRLTDFADEAFHPGHPAWSPDGTRIAFTGTIDGQQEIYVMDRDGTNRIRLTTVAGNDYSPDWSPDGTRIAFVSTRQTGTHLYVMNADGTGQTRLTNNDWGTNYGPSWSPDGARIAFTRYSDDEVSQIYIINTDGTNLTALTHSSDSTVIHTASGASWSPDGTQIVFERHPYGNLFVRNADGTHETHLVTTGGDLNARQDLDWQSVPSPGAFAKSSPSNGAAHLAPVATTLTWTESYAATNYEYCLETSVNEDCDGSWVAVGDTTSAVTAGLAESTTYQWQVRATNTAGSVSANGGTWFAFATGRAFTDEPLTTSHQVRVIHINELRQRIDPLRMSRGLGTFGWTDAVLMAGATPVRAIHITELRSALAGVYVAAEREAVVYTDSTVTPAVTPVKRIHIMELRDAVRAVE